MSITEEQIKEATEVDETAIDELIVEEVAVTPVFMVKANYPIDKYRISGEFKEAVKHFVRKGTLNKARADFIVETLNAATEFAESRLKDIRNG